MFHYTKLLHVKKSKEEVKQLLLAFKFDIQIFRYYGEETAENRIRLIPKKTELIGYNSFMPIVDCFLTSREDGTDIKLVFDLHKWTKRIMPIEGTFLLFMAITFLMSGGGLAGLMPFVLIFFGMIFVSKIEDWSFQRSSKRVVKKIIEVLGSDVVEVVPENKSQNKKKLSV